MIGKLNSGNSFAASVRYVLQKEQAVLLEVFGVRSYGISAMIQDFNIQRSGNPGLGKAAGHVSLSWNKNDRHLLSPGIMAERAREYLKLMKIVNTQYIIVQHKDRQHIHLHIVYNRVNNQLKTISDSYSYLENLKVCKLLDAKYGYQFSENRQEVNRGSLWGKDKTKYEFFDSISDVLKVANGWNDFESLLKNRGMELLLKYKSETNEVLGISFRKGHLKMKGSAIAKELSYHALNEMLESKQMALQRNHEEFIQKLRDAASDNESAPENRQKLVSRESFKQSALENTLALFETAGHHFAGNVENDDAGRSRKYPKENEHGRNSASINR